MLSGLQGGEEVVANGAFTPDAAAQLKGGKSMMNPGGAAPNATDNGPGATSGAPALSAEEVAAFKQVLKPYLRVKDALVASDSETARAAAREALQLLADQPEGGVLEAIREQFEFLAGAGELDGLREGFLRLSGQMIQTGAGVGHFGQTLYIQYCPMANRNQGGTWISEQEEIRNPYYGDSMLTCGEVSKELK